MKICKNEQIIIRMTSDEKQELKNIAHAGGRTVSNLVRSLVFEYIRQKRKNK